MANLTLNIEVNDEDFKKLCTENINSLPKDKMEEILLKAVETALIKDTSSSMSKGNILIKPENPNSIYCNWVPTDLMKEILATIDMNKYAGPLAEKMASYINEHYEEMIKRYIVEAFTNMLFSQVDKSSIYSRIDMCWNNIENLKNK